MGKIISNLHKKYYYFKDVNAKFDATPGTSIGASSNITNNNQLQVGPYDINGNAYKYTNTNAHKLMLDSDVTKKDFVISIGIPSYAEGYDANYCISSTGMDPSQTRSKLKDYRVTQSHHSDEQTGWGGTIENKGAPFIIKGNPNTQVFPYLNQYCLGSTDYNGNGNNWYYWNGSSFANTSWINIPYYYSGGHGSGIETPGRELHVMGWKLYVINYSEDMIDYYDYVASESINSFRATLDQYEYETYGSGFIKNWVDNDPIEDILEVSDLIPYNQVWLKTMGTDNVGSIYNQALTTIGPYLSGKTLLGLELAVVDKTIGTSIVVPFDQGNVTPVIPSNSVNGYQSISTNPYEVDYSPIYIAPEVLTNPSYYYYYGKSWQEYYGMTSAGVPEYGNVNMYGLFYLIPICHYRLNVGKDIHNLAYSTNSLCITMHKMGPAATWF